MFYSLIFSIFIPSSLSYKNPLNVIFLYSLLPFVSEKISCVSQSYYIIYSFVLFYFFHPTPSFETLLLYSLFKEKLWLNNLSKLYLNHWHFCQGSCCFMLLIKLCFNFMAKVFCVLWFVNFLLISCSCVAASKDLDVEFTSDRRFCLCLKPNLMGQQLEMFWVPHRLYLFVCSKTLFLVAYLCSR